MVRLALQQTTHEEWLAQTSLVPSSPSSSIIEGPDQNEAEDTTFFSCSEDSIHEQEPIKDVLPAKNILDVATDNSDDDSVELSAEPQAPCTPRAEEISDDEDEDDLIFGSRRTPFILGARKSVARKSPELEIPVAADEDEDSDSDDGSEFVPSPPPKKTSNMTPFSVSSPSKMNRTVPKPVPAFLRRLQGLKPSTMPDDRVVMDEIQPSPQKQRPQITLKRDPNLSVTSSLPSLLSKDEIDSLSREMGDLAVGDDHILEHTPNRFRRPPKIVKRTSSSIFDLSDSEPETEKESKIVSTKKIPSTPQRSLSAMTPRTKVKPAKPLAPKTVERLRRKDFEEKKEQIAKDYLKLLDDTVNGGAVARMTAATGGIQLVWTNAKQTTAGTCQTIRYSAGLGEDRTSAYFSCVITLESKVCDDVERIKDTLAHEYTHACVDILEIDRRQLKTEGPHGRLFKNWAKKVGKAMNIQTPETCHNLEINYKFEYQCTLCDRVYKAHSRKPAWTTSKGCELCKVPLVQIKPVPRAKGTTPYQAFQKETLQN